MRGTVRGGPTSSRAGEEEHLLMGCNLGFVPRPPSGGRRDAYRSHTDLP